MRASGSTAVSRRLLWALTRFHPETSRDESHAVESWNRDTQFFDKRMESASVTPTEVSFGPFRLFPKQFLLLEGGKPVPLGSRALNILIILLERPGELVSKEELLARVWPNIFVEPANITVHMSMLRRMLRDGRDGNRFIINIPGRGYTFVTSVEVSPGKIQRGPSKMEATSLPFRPSNDDQLALIV
jgi:DNA-binding winged helix-turn-helix (wHTH) protein